MSRAMRLLPCVLTATMLIPSVAWSQVRDLPLPTPPPRQPGTPPVGIRVGEIDPRDRRPTPQTGTGSIKGRVVDGVTGRPINRARVRLSGAAQKGPILTDDAGQFEFASLAPGPFTLFTEKSTYLGTRYPEPNRSLRNRNFSIQLKDGQALDDVSVPMFHGGAITGRVMDAHGDPVDMANITVLFLPKGGRPQQRGGSATNDLGEFRIPRLQPGRYIVRARGQNAINPETNNPSEKPLPQPLPVYFPNALSPDQAQAVVVNRGETVSGIDIMLGEGVPTLVAGMVIPMDGQQISGGSINFRLASAAIETGGSDGGTGLRPDGTFRLQLPPGEYLFEVNAQPPRLPNQPFVPGKELFGSARVNVAGDAVEGIVIPVGNGATASGRIVFEGRTPPPVNPVNPTRVPMFNPDGPGCRGGMATVAPDWTFKVEGLGGVCASQPMSIFGRWTLKSVVVGGQNLMDQLVTFQPGQHYGNVRIVVTDKRPEVDVRVLDESGQPTRDYVVLVFPADKDRWTQIGRYVRTLVSSSAPPPGGVPPAVLAAMANRGPVENVSRLSNISPGDYYAVAIDDMDPEDSLDPGILEKLIPAAVRLTVTADVPAEVQLRRTPLADVIR